MTESLYRIGAAMNDDVKSKVDLGFRVSVELDVQNALGLLSPGMYPEVSWPVLSQGEALLVPRTSVVTTTEWTFVIRVKDGRAEWVNVKRGAADGDQV